MKPLWSTPPAPWKQRYETLRQYSLEGQPLLATVPLGLGWVYRQGVAGWMRQWSEAEPTGPPTSPTPLTPALRPAVPPGGQQQLTHLLAQITMTHLFASGL